MTKSTNAQRKKFAIEVMQRLAETRIELPVTRNDGTRPIVVALDDELLVDVMHRVRDAGGAANTFVKMNDGHLELLETRTGTKIPSSATDLGKDPLDKRITIGIIVDVAAHDDNGVRFWVTRPGVPRSERFGFVDREELVPV
jgi:hypothetical protein